MRGHNSHQPHSKSPHQHDFLVSGHGQSVQVRHGEKQHNEIRDNINHARGEPQGVIISTEAALNGVVPIESDGLTDECRANDHGDGP